MARSYFGPLAARRPGDSAAQSSKRGCPPLPAGARRSPPMRLAPHLFALTLGSVLLACSSTPDTTVTIARPQLVAVDPQDFLGSQQCGDKSGMVGSYVATLYDVTPVSDGGTMLDFPFPLPSSPPTSCFFPVTFSYVLVDHRYRALIEAYEQKPDPAEPDAGAGDADAGDAGDGGVELPPIHSFSIGGRLQVDRTGTPVMPRWTATCGGYPPTITEAGVPDAAAYITTADEQDAAANDAAAIPGVISYDAITQTVHNCGQGLVPAAVN
jgi:hypothetical protein